MLPRVDGVISISIIAKKLVGFAQVGMVLRKTSLLQTIQTALLGRMSVGQVAPNTLETVPTNVQMVAIVGLLTVSRTQNP
jgi:hypothetical protein|mmetsp:Transcript_110832/g.174752  ORF Transcript_110832/g.174752 Transcript_110832/m.174752 type:complete len:80 (-) Transcript_110832:327-566(-)